MEAIRSHKFLQILLPHFFQYAHFELIINSSQRIFQSFIVLSFSDFQKLEREARICRKLQHPNIGEWSVVLSFWSLEEWYGWWRGNNTPCLSMNRRRIDNTKLDNLLEYFFFFFISFPAAFILFFKLIESSLITCWNISSFFYIIISFPAAFTLFFNLIESLNPILIYIILLLCQRFNLLIRFIN